MTDARAPSILNVDDDAAGRYIKSRALREAGWEVVEAASVAEAIDLAEARAPDLALIDVNLPDGSGLDLCETVKTRWPATMVLQISATSIDISDRVRGLDRGADSYLTQPVEPVELVAVVRALLRLRKAEQELRFANDTLEERVRVRTEELQEAEAKLRQAQKMEALGQLTGGIAHDFNNLLTVIIGNMTRVRAQVEDRAEVDVSRINNSLDAAQRAATLTQRLLAFSRRQPLQPRTIDVAGLFRGLSEILSHTVGSQVELAFEASGDVWPAWADENQLENALLNLSLNARDAMPNGGKIALRAANAVAPFAGAGDFVLFEVIDDGAGMSPSVLERAFDPFFTTKPVGQGTGLGLSQVYGFVRQSEGEIKIESEEGRGTRVALYLPRAGAGKGAVGTERVGAVDSGGGRRVLLVEDEILVLMVAVESLAEQGYDVLSTSNPEEALALLASDPTICLLVTDVGLPGMNGRQLVERARERRPELDVVFMTGYDPSAAGAGDQMSARTSVLQKPFTPTQLQQKVGDVLRG